jgi:DeoR/GlpR family transcriptional regulator of sugar metabolism
MPRNKQSAVDSRRKEILEEVCMNDEVNISMLAKKHNTSQMTIWRDMEILQKHNYIQKTNIGSVKKNEDLSLDPDIYKRSKIRNKQKVAIALEAIGLVEDGDVLGLDSSTTVLELAKLLFTKNNLMVVSNNMLLMPVLYNHPAMQFISAGGMLKMKGYSTEGEIAVETIRQFNYDKVFISANAVDAAFGLSNIETFETATKKAFLKSAKKIIVLADGSKIGKRAIHQFGTFDIVDTLITDDSADPDQLKKIEKQGVKIIYCRVESTDEDMK